MKSFLRSAFAVPALLGMSVFTTGCAPITSRTEPPPKGGSIHTYSQGGSGAHANIFWINTPSGAIVIDAPLLTSEAKYLRGQLGVPYRLFTTSPRPEHWASIDTLRAGDVPTATTPAVATEIKNYGDQRLGALRKHMGDDVPKHVEPPTPSIEERTHDMLSDIEFEIIPMGPADTEAAMAVFLPRSGELVAGELVANNAHLDLTWGRSALWADRISELKALEPKLVYGSHGEPGGPELLDDELAYLKFFHDTVAAHVRPGAPARIAPEEKQAIIRAMKEKFPRYDRDDLLDAGVRGEYAVQLAALPPAASSGPAGEGTAADPAAPPPSSTSTAPPAAKSDAAPATTAAPAATAAPASDNSGAVDDLLGDSKSTKKKKKKKSSN